MRATRFAHSDSRAVLARGVPLTAIVQGPAPRTHELLGIFERLVESFMRLELFVSPRVEDDSTTVPSNFSHQLPFIYVYPAEVALLNFAVMK